MTLNELRVWLTSAPPGTMVPVEALRRTVDSVEPAEVAVVGDQEAPPMPWRVIFWTCDPQVRIGRPELLEALGRTTSWLYRHTATGSTNRIPHRKLHGELVFLIGAVRRWLSGQEEIIVAVQLDEGRSISTLRPPDRDEIQKGKRPKVEEEDSVVGSER